MIEQGSSQPTARSGSAPSNNLHAKLSSGCINACDKNNNTTEINNNEPLVNSALNSNEQRPSAASAIAIANPQCLPVLVHHDDAVHRPFVSSQQQQQQQEQEERENLMPFLHIRTDLSNAVQAPIDTVSPPKESTDTPGFHQSLSTASLPKRTPSLRATIARPSSSAESFSPASIVSSPQLAAMADITPLPSPVYGYMSSWKGDSRRNSLSSSRTPSVSSNQGLRHVESLHMPAPSISRSRFKQYPGLDRYGDDHPVAARKLSFNSPAASSKHVRDRSLSDNVPASAGKVMPVPPRSSAISGTDLKDMAPSSKNDPKSNVLHRENYLAVDRGIALPPARPLTPPRSSRGSSGDVDEGPVVANVSYQDIPQEIYFVRSVRTQQLRKYRMLRQLGQGTFSQVSLAVRLETDNMNGFSLHGMNNNLSLSSSSMPSSSSPSSSSSSSQKLVAVKIVEYGPAGGVDEDRVEVSLKREVDILKSVNHPSLVQLKAFGSDEKRALLVLDYCPGGDLFDFASSPLNAMSPCFIRRVFAELVDAVRYLHKNFIVHRDIKLENVLVNISPSTVESITDWQTYDRAVVTLTDLGLSRRIPEPPESPLLSTRCGSEDYAAPEILMGQPYDGRSTDAWALGVLLYAIMENRLPFDALPGTRGDPATLRARTPHRIARCEWSWYRYADSDEEWDPIKGKDLEGARECVESLLKKNTKRRSLDEISGFPWVRDAICVSSGGLKRGDKEVP